MYFSMEMRFYLSNIYQFKRYTICTHNNNNNYNNYKSNVDFNRFKMFNADSNFYVIIINNFIISVCNNKYICICSLINLVN